MTKSSNELFPTRHDFFFFFTGKVSGEYIILSYRKPPPVIMRTETGIVDYEPGYSDRAVSAENNCRCECRRGEALETGGDRRTGGTHSRLSHTGVGLHVLSRHASQSLSSHSGS